MGLGAIIDGHVKEFTGSNAMLSKERMEICKSCPLYKVTPVLGAICNNKLYMNKETGDTSEQAKIGYVRGCACRLSAKTRLPYAHCPADKW